MKFLFAIIVLIPSWIFSATVKGNVKSEVDNTPLSGATIQIIKSEDIHKGCVTDENGNFTLENLPIGEYTIKVHFIGYFTQTVSLSLSKIEDLVNLNIKLKRGLIYIDTLAAIENYHRYFNRFRPEDVLDIHIDSLEYEKIKIKEKSYYKILLHLTFTNKTDSAIFVLKEWPCFFVIKPLIKNSKGEVMKPNMFFPDCMGEKDMPDSTDFLKIPPHSSIKYPPYSFQLYSILYYPKDIYTISIQYFFKRKDKLPGFYSDPDKDYKNSFKKQIYYFNMALRGTFNADNDVKFDNTSVLH